MIDITFALIIKAIWFFLIFLANIWLFYWPAHPLCLPKCFVFDRCLHLLLLLFNDLLIVFVKSDTCFLKLDSLKDYDLKFQMWNPRCLFLFPLEQIDFFYKCLGCFTLSRWFFINWFCVVLTPILRRFLMMTFWYHITLITFTAQCFKNKNFFSIIVLFFVLWRFTKYDQYCTNLLNREEPDYWLLRLVNLMNCISGLVILCFCSAKKNISLFPVWALFWHFA